MKGTTDKIDAARRTVAETEEVGAYLYTKLVAPDFFITTGPTISGVTC